MRAAAGWSKMAAAPCATTAAHRSDGRGRKNTAPMVSGGSLTVWGTPGSLEEAGRARGEEKEPRCAPDWQSSSRYVRSAQIRLDTIL